MRGAKEVTIKRLTSMVGTGTGEWFVVSDEGGEFARATTIPAALRYAEDLLEGPSTTGLPEVRHEAR